jgi:hypothetical protein
MKFKTVSYFPVLRLGLLNLLDLWRYCATLVTQCFTLQAHKKHRLKEIRRIASGVIDFI